MNKEGFKKLCLPVKEDLLAWLHQQLSEYYGLANTVNGGDYLFFSGNCPTMLCAHLDTVHRRQPPLQTPSRQPIRSVNSGVISEPPRSRAL